MPLPILTVAQMRAWEQATWAAGVSEADVIARVGEGVAQKVRERVPAGARVLLLAGKGNNGNDVRAAHRHLETRGDDATTADSLPGAAAFQPPELGGLKAPRYGVTLLDVGSPADALTELQRLLALRPVLVVDGLFGIGLNRPLSPEWRQFIETINASGLPVLAVDVPSGLDADTGGHFGAVVRATVTLTVGAPKRGLIQEAATGCVGRLEVASDVGLLPDPARVAGERTGLRPEDGWKFLEAWTLPEDFTGFPPARPLTSHKGTFGHVVIVAGSLGYHGAVVLAARAAGAARPGLVTVITSPSAYPAVAAQLAFAMVRPWDEPLEFPAKMSALLVGPGLAGTDVPDWLRAQTLTWWKELPVPVIADASALDWLGAEDRRFIGSGPMKAAALGSEILRASDEWHERPKSQGAVRIITPHPGEALRWVNADMQSVMGDRNLLLQYLASANCWVVLKGHQTLVRGKDAPTFINPTGNPGLAQGGSGDVLAGFLAGLLAQPALLCDPLLTVRYAVWEHGAAADRLEARRHNWTAEDLTAEIGR